MTAWISATEAARKLRVNRATLYAYVSRGLVRSEALPGKTRSRRYSREDVERLGRRSEARRNPERAAEHALRWGLPVLESAITLIADGKLFYRGHDVAELVRSRSVEEVASLVWTGAFDSDIAETTLHVVAGDHSAASLPFVSRCQSVLPLVGARDSLALDLRPHGVAQTGWRILNLMASVAAETPDLAPTIEETLVQSWSPRDKKAPELLRAALILSADHELNVSSFTARCVASAGATPYAVVIAGLSAIEGSKHGGISGRVEALFDEFRNTRDLRRKLADRLRRGEGIAGFGHPLYPDGDPRAKILLDLLRERDSRSAELRFALDFEEAAESLLREKPTIDFALVVLARVLRLPPGTPLTLFAIGRAIGWIGHAIEQYAIDTVIRPRAKYVGVTRIDR
ncbi:MAG: citrate/2-methylcitrate synthase [Thermoanaerobaculia bacterium]